MANRLRDEPGCSGPCEGQHCMEPRVHRSVQQGHGVVSRFGAARLHRGQRGGVGASRGNRLGLRAVDRCRRGGRRLWGVPQWAHAAAGFVLETWVACFQDAAGLCEHMAV